LQQQLPEPDPARGTVPGRGDLRAPGAHSHGGGQGQRLAGATQVGRCEPGRSPGVSPGARMTALLTAEGISKAFGGVQALDGCTVEVQAGSITGLIGPNGSGKTTLFNVITGYDRPDAGEVFYAGRRITGSSPQRVFAAGIGRTFQLTRIFPRLTVLE